jgi:hypothetical protein
MESEKIKIIDRYRRKVGTHTKSKFKVITSYRQVEKFLEDLRKNDYDFQCIYPASAEELKDPRCPVGYWVCPTRKSKFCAPAALVNKYFNKVNGPAKLEGEIDESYGTVRDQGSSLDDKEEEDNRTGRQEIERLETKIRRTKDRKLPTFSGDVEVTIDDVRLYIIRGTQQERSATDADEQALEQDLGDVSF